MEFTLDEVLAFKRKMFETALELVKRKGHDYNRQQQTDGNTLFNLMVCELLGIVDTAERGILVRLSDKFMRLVSLAATPGVDPAVKDESVLDTVADFHNYVDYVAQIWLKRRALAGARGRRGKSKSPK